MLISHGHRFIFIKTRKTAGTSLEVLLSPHLAHPDDVITPITPEDEELRRPQGVTPKNYLEPDGKTKRFWNHITAAEIRELIPPQWWESYRKITIERHPYEKAVSLAWFRFNAATALDGDFGRHLDKIIEEARYHNFDFYSIGGKVVADTILRYEHLQEDARALVESLGLGAAAAELPRAKGEFRKDRTPARETLSPAQKKRIQDICREEFEFFGYAP